MAPFGSYTYQTFEEYIKTCFRYCYHEQVEAFLNAVLHSSERRRIQWPSGKSLVRAQRGCQVLTRTKGGAKWKDNNSGEVIDSKCKPYEEMRMVPEAEKTIEGRANPKGIPCLYLATHPHTAMSEARAVLHGKISLATFETAKPLSLVDCTLHNRESTQEAFNWNLINGAFSNPVSDTDDVADYAPTQVLAEAFRQHGYHGILYQSHLSHHGQNVALFELDYAKFTHCTLHRLRSASFEFDEMKLGSDGAAI